MGGSATTDGGWGALEVLEPHSRLAGVDMIVACDVTTRFTDAAATFAPQKGASPAQVELLSRRLERLAQVYLQRFGVDVQTIEGSGAAGGLAGGLAALGASLVSGFEVVADRTDLADKIEAADLVLTGEGYLDEESFNGKAVGGVMGLAKELGVPVVVIAGDADEQALGAASVHTLVGSFGEERAMNDTLGAVSDVVQEVLSALG
jgi:glycerate kinase